MKYKIITFYWRSVDEAYSFDAHYRYLYFDLIKADKLDILHLILKD